MRRASLFASGFFLLTALALADERKAPDAPECKTFLKTQRARLVELHGAYAWKHAEPVETLAFAAHSVLAASPGGLTTWERASGRELETIPLGGRLLVSKDTTRALVLAGDLACYDLASRKTLWRADGRALAACFSDDGKRVLASFGTEVALHDAEKGHVLRTLHLDSPASLVALSPDGKRAFVGDAKKLQGFELDHGRKEKPLESDSSFTALAWTDGVVVTGSEDGKVRAWDRERGRPVWERTHKKAIVALAVSSRGVLALSSDGAVVLRDPLGNDVRSFENPGARAVALASDGLAAASAGTVVHIHDLSSGRTLVFPDQGHDGALLALAVSFDQIHVLSAGADRTARLWNTGAPRAFRVLEGHEAAVSAVAFSPDATDALTGSEDGTVKLWDMKTGLAVKAFLEAGPAGAVGFVGASVVAASTDGLLHVFDLESAKKTLDFGTSGGRAPVAISGTLALVANEKGGVKLWDLAARRETRTLEGHVALRAVALSADGKRALGGGRGVLKLWDAQSASELRSLDVGDATVSALALSADSKLALSATEDGKVVLWDLESGRSIDGFTLAASRDHARAAAFTKDGFLLGTARGVLLRFEWLGT